MLELIKTTVTLALFGIKQFHEMHTKSSINEIPGFQGPGVK